MSATQNTTRLGVKLAVGQLLVLALIVWLGTLLAARDGVPAAQARVFESLGWWQPIAFGWSLPLPGVRLLLLTLFCTLVLDPSAWRLRRGRRAVAVLHLGVALLLTSGLWSASRGYDGVVTLRPGEASAHMRSTAGLQPLPFTLRFVDFNRTLHPHTEVLQDLWAEVEVVDHDGLPQRTRITLNQPLRQSGVSVHLDETQTLGNTNRYGEATFRVLHDPSTWLRNVALVLLLLGMAGQFVAKLAHGRGAV